MAQSSAVLDGNTALAEEYNDLRNDVLSTTLGHLHDGTNGREPGDQQQKLRNPADTFSYTIRTSAIAAARDLTLPLLTANDTLAVLGLAQTLTNKTLTTPTIADFSNAGHNHEAAAGGATLGHNAATDNPTVAHGATGAVVGTTNAQTLTNKTLTSPVITTSPTAAGATWADLGSVTTVDINGGTIDGVTIGASAAPSQIRVQDNGLQIENPAATFVYTVTGAAIAAARQLNLPLITGTDTLASLGLAQTFSTLQTFSASVDVTGGTVQNSTGNLTLSAAAGSDVLIGDDVTILYVDGGTGTVGLGIAATSTRTINVFREASNPVATQEGIVSDLQVQETGGANANITRSVFALAEIDSGNTQNWTATVGIRGVNTAIGSTGSPSGTVTGLAGLYVQNANLQGTLVATNQYGIYIEDLTAGTNDYGIYIAGADTAAIFVAGGLVDIDGGSVVVGNPTGGDKGAGTINATAVYDDNVLLTDYVFEPGYKMLPVLQMVAYFEKEHHLPTIPGRQEWEKQGQFSVGQLATHLWETAEVHARYIGEHEARFSTVEDRMDTLQEANEILRQQLVDANLIPEA